VIPACPPTTGMSTSLTSSPFASATNVFERTTSNVVTPKTLNVGVEFKGVGWS
jgi:hypothetical protein